MTKEDRFTEISDTLDEWPEDEQDFALWHLLQNFIAKGNKELAKIPKSKEEFICYRMTERLTRAAEDMREIIGYDIF